MARHPFSLLAAVVLCCVFCGCTLLLPKESKVTRTPWSSFDEVKAAFEKVSPHSTTTGQLKVIGFNIYSTPNLRVLNYLEIASATVSLNREELSEGLAICFRSQAKCMAYEFEPQEIQSKRYGNLLLDILNFHRKSRETGWRFKALYVVVDDLVVDKFWSGAPFIDREQENINPLGPLQDIGGITTNMVLK